MSRNRGNANRRSRGQPPRGRQRRAARAQNNSQLATRSQATRVLANAVGSVTSKAFGSEKGYGLHCWRAHTPHHMPLPRSVGPYTVIRGTRRVQIDEVANIIGSFKDPDGGWSEVIMVSSNSASNNMNNINNAKTTTVELGGLGDAATLVPSAVSVQIMCPTALQTASGVVYAGVMHTQAAVANRAETWDSYMNKFVQFQSPRLMAASKLALRGVEISSYPLSMSQVSEFTPLDKTTDSLITFNSTQPETQGWAPIVVYNPSGATLELLITVEYRVRFDLDHPASASHQHHPVTSDSMWDRMVKGASSLGHGVMDIADTVSNTGMAVGRAMAVGQKLMQLTNMLPTAALAA